MPNSKIILFLRATVFGCAVFAVALLLRWIYWEKTGHFIMPDSVSYVQRAEEIHATGGFGNLSEYDRNNYRMVFYCWLVSRLMPVQGSGEIAAAWLSMISGSLLAVVGCIGGWLLCRRRAFVILTAMILIVHPTLLTNSTYPLRDMPFLFAFVSSLVFFTLGTRPGGWAWNIPAGCCFIIALSLRIEAIEFFLFLPVVCCFGVYRQHAGAKSIISGLAIFLLSATAAMYALSYAMWSTDEQFRIVMNGICTGMSRN